MKYRNKNVGVRCEGNVQVSVGERGNQSVLKGCGYQERMSNKRVAKMLCNRNGRKQREAEVAT